MNKLKKWVWKKLGVTDVINAVDEIKYIQKEIKGERAEIIGVGLQVKQLHDSMRNIFSIGMDLSVKGDSSWAVICSNGETKYVRFIDLRGKDIHEIEKFLKHFESSVVDAPFGVFKRLPTV